MKLVWKMEHLFQNLMESNLLLQMVYVFYLIVHWILYHKSIVEEVPNLILSLLSLQDISVLPWPKLSKQ